MDRVNCWMPGVIPMSPWAFELYLPAIWRLRRHRSWLVDTRQQPSLFTSEEKHDSGSFSCCAEKERERQRESTEARAFSFFSEYNFMNPITGVTNVRRHFNTFFSWSCRRSRWMLCPQEGTNCGEMMQKWLGEVLGKTSQDHYCQ